MEMVIIFSQYLESQVNMFVNGSLKILLLLKAISINNRKDVKKMLEKIRKNWMRISFIMIAVIGLFESFTCFESATGRTIGIIISMIIMLIGIFNSGEDLLD